MVVLKELGQEDVIQIQKLLEVCSKYFVFQDEKSVEQGDALKLLIDRPEGVDIKNKLIFGIYNDKENKMIGIIDLIKDYVDPGTLSLGLMLLEPQNRSKGKGRDAYKKLEEWVVNKRFTKIRLGVLFGNEKGLKFWVNMGYKKTGEIKPYLTKKFLVMEKSL